MATRRDGLPGWAEYGLLPLLNLAAAFLVSGLVVLLVGENPLKALVTLIDGAFGYGEAIGYTFYYATNFIFTGLAVAIAFHAGLFNIGGEGQAYIGGLGAGMVCLLFPNLPALIEVPFAILAAAVFGAAWAAIPAYLQAYRGSHIVITTIMFNFLAAALMTYLLVNVLIKPGQQSPESAEFVTAAWLPTMQAMLGLLGIKVPASPLNFAFIWALICAGFFQLFLWRTRWGYEVRATGFSAGAALYAGIAPGRVIVLAMLLSGAVAGFVAVNELLGVQHRILLNFPSGYGFVGIAVALIGRNRPLGIVFAAILFGALYQGGSELAFEMPKIKRELVVVIQGLVILFCGALENLFRTPLSRILRIGGN